jgi:excisionase family DNA binding protein
LRSTVTEERLSLRDAADALGISEVTARRWVKSGKLKAYQPGRKYLIPASAIDELLDEPDGPKVLLPFDVLEVNAEVIRTTNPSNVKELREALDAEYVRQLKDFSVEQLMETERRLLESSKKASAAAGGEQPTTDPLILERLLRVSDELRAVMVARVAKGVLKRSDYETPPDARAQ